MLFADGRVADSGEVLEAKPPKKLVLKWRNEFREDLKEAGYSPCTYEIEPHGEAGRFSVTHVSESRAFIEAVSGGWPMILSNLKSLLETGKVATAQALGLSTIKCQYVKFLGKLGNGYLQIVRIIFLILATLALIVAIMRRAFRP